ncbi:hypothetical protein E2C01_063800 [Portunus trituberculatus]|uniref:Uncharacterized protein n=1 Tax=Portunus trituberculatus TaxID=210409 RepID=A0A5B7HA44_PORTR|nr:hypothetical protein [Portunus trituberculatus]
MNRVKHGEAGTQRDGAASLRTEVKSSAAHGDSCWGTRTANNSDYNVASFPLIRISTTSSPTSSSSSSSSASSSPTDHTRHSPHWTIPRPLER